MCTYNLGRGNKRKGFEGFWEAKPGLTRCDIWMAACWIPSPSTAPLYRTLSAGAHPRFETIKSVLHALGVKFAAVAERES